MPPVRAYSSKSRSTSPSSLYERYSSNENGNTSISNVRPVKSVDKSLDSKKAFDPVMKMSYCSDA